MSRSLWEITWDLKELVSMNVCSQCFRLSAALSQMGSALYFLFNLKNHCTTIYNYLTNKAPGPYTKVRKAERGTYRICAT